MSAAVAVKATTRGLGRTTSAVVMAKADMVGVDMEDMANKAETAMDKEGTEAMVVGMEEMEADIREVDMVVAVVAAVEGDIRNLTR